MYDKSYEMFGSEADSVDSLKKTMLSDMPRRCNRAIALQNRACQVKI
jgi:hypothetical protein